MAVCTNFARAPPNEEDAAMSRTCGSGARGWMMLLGLAAYRAGKAVDTITKA